MDKGKFVASSWGQNVSGPISEVHALVKVQNDRSSCRKRSDWQRFYRSRLGGGNHFGTRPVVAALQSLQKCASIVANVDVRIKVLLEANAGHFKMAVY